MGVTRILGRLFGGDADAGDLPLRAYGKLPLYAEYRRLEVAPGTATAFTQWMDAGRLAWVRSPSHNEHSSTRPSRLLLRIPESRDIVIASVWDSRDSLGRVFPFAFFVICPAQALPDDPVTQWTAALAIHRTFDRYYHELSVLGQGGDFYRLYGKRKLILMSEDLDRTVSAIRTDAAKIGIDPWFRNLGKDGEAADWLASVRRRAGRWREATTGLSEVAVTCPLADGLPVGPQVALWLDWLTPLIRRAARHPGLVAPADGTQGAALHLLLRDVLPDDFQLLTTDAPSYGFIERLGEAASTSGNANVPVAKPVDAEAQPQPEGDASLLTWLRREAALAPSPPA